MIGEIYLGAKAALYVALFSKWSRKKGRERKEKRLEHLREIGKVCTWGEVLKGEVPGEKLFAITFGYGIEFWVVPAHQQAEVDAVAEVINNGMCVDPPPPMAEHKPSRGKAVYAPITRPSLH